MISKNWPFLFDMLTKLFIFDFKYISLWQTIFKKLANPTNLFLSSSTWIGLLQNLEILKALAKVDNLCKDTKMFFSFAKNVSCGTESLCELASDYYKNFHQLLLNQGHNRNIHCNTVIFCFHVHWSISLGCNSNLGQI